MIARIHQFLDASSAKAPGAPALRDWNGARYDYAAFDAMVADTVMLLRQRGLRPGDRLLIMAENAASLIVLVMAASRMNAVAVPVNARLTTPELAKIAAHTQPRLTVFLSDVSKAAANHADIADVSPLPLQTGAVLVGVAQDCAPEAVIAGSDMTAVILYTTGTTGTPKGVMLSHGNLIFGGQASAALRRLVADDLIYGVLPMTHVFGLTSMLVAGISAGAQIWLAPRFSAAAVLEALQQDVTVLPAVPQMHAAVMAEARARGIDRLTGPLRYVSSGAAPLDPDWKRRAEAFYGIAVQNGYGMTETTAGVCITDNPVGSPDNSTGHPLPGVEVRLDETIGREAGTGEVLTRGPHIMLGYFRNEQATAQVLGGDGWLRTGDLGRFDDQGRLHIVGRSKELIIRGGFNVYPPEVEAALNDHPAVLQSAVIGRALAGGNEEVLAFCQLATPGSVTEPELAAHAAARLSPYKRPARIFLTGPLPAASTGKILKHRLLDHFSDLLDQVLGTTR